MKKTPDPVFDPPSPEGIADPELVAKLTRLYGNPWDLDDRNAIAALKVNWWARLVVEEQGILHDPDEKQFYEYDEIGGLYESVSHWALQDRASFRILRASRDAGFQQLERTRYHSVKAQKDLVEAMRAVSNSPEPFKPQKELGPAVALGNGVAVLRPGGIKLEAFSRNFRLRFKAPVDFDPKARCPRFEREFLGTMLEEEEDRDLLVRQLGLMLFGINPAHRMCILEGDSAAGKTSLANIMVALLGENQCLQLRTEFLDSQFELDALRGKSLLLGNDVGSNFLSTPGAQTLKGIVSTDLYHPEAKNRRDRRPLRGPFNLLIGTNSRLAPRVQGDSAAWRRRMVLYPIRKPEGRKRIMNFEHILLKEEGSGIVNLLLDGGRRALKEVEAFGDLRMTDEQVGRVERLVLRADPIETYLTTCLIKEEGEDTTSDELTHGYYDYCRRANLTPVAEDYFQVKAKGIIALKFGIHQRRDISRDSDGKTTDRRGWRGLRLQIEEFRPTSVDPF